MFNLYQGDCLDVMKEIPDNCIDLVLTDPPYGITACKWDSVIPFEPMWAQLKRVVKKSGAIVLFCNEPFSSALRMSNIKCYRYDWAWQKSQLTGHLNAWRRPMKEIENIAVFSKSTPSYYPVLSDRKPENIRPRETKMLRPSKCYGGQKKEYVSKCPPDKNMPRTIIKFNNVQGNVHPTQKPVALMEYLIRTYTHPGETVLDFTMGSGTTGVAARRLARYFIGIELDPGYFEIAKKRIEDV